MRYLLPLTGLLFVALLITSYWPSVRGQLGGPAVERTGSASVTGTPDQDRSDDLAMEIAGLRVEIRALRIELAGLRRDIHDAATTYSRR